MKRIIVSAICVVMCCIFLCQYVAAEVDTISFNLSGITLTNIYRYDLDGNLLQNGTFNVAGVQNGNTWTFSPNFYQHTTMYPDHTFIATTQFNGAWETVSTQVEEYLWFIISMDNVFDYDLYFNAFNMQQIKVKLGDTEYDNYALSQTSDQSYLLTFHIPLSGIDYDFLSMTSFQVTLPVTPAVGDDGIQIAFQLYVDNIKLKYSFPAITSGDVDLIINSLDNVEVMLDEVTQNQNIVIDEIIATREVIAENGEKLQEISNKQDTIITELEQLPDALRDLDLGTVETAAIPQDELDELAGIEDELYNYSDSKIQYVDQSIDQLNITLNSHLGNVGTAHDLFFTRVFEIEFIRDLVYISLGFGLVAFILRMGRKIQ